MFEIVFVSVTNFINLNNVNLLSHSSIGQRSGQSVVQLIICSRLHGAKIKMLAGLHSFPEILG